MRARAGRGGGAAAGAGGAGGRAGRPPTPPSSGTRARPGAAAGASTAHSTQVSSPPTTVTARSLRPSPSCHRRRRWTPAGTPALRNRPPPSLPAAAPPRPPRERAPRRGRARRGLPPPPPPRPGRPGPPGARPPGRRALETLPEPLGGEGDEVPVQDRDVVGVEERADDVQEDPRRHLHHPQVRPKPPVEAQEGVQSQGAREEGDPEAQGIRPQHEDAGPGRLARPGQEEDGPQDGAHAG